MALEQELKPYEKQLTELLAHEGQYVLIHGDEVVGCYDTYADATQAGYEKFALAPFLVKQVWAVEPVHFIAAPPCLI